jgi:hypothetical protein
LSKTEHYQPFRTKLNRSQSQESLMRPIPFPILVPDRRAYVERAHRLRSAVVAGLFRDFVRWVSAAAR